MHTKKATQKGVLTLPFKSKGLKQIVEYTKIFFSWKYETLHFDNMDYMIPCALYNILL